MQFHPLCAGRCLNHCTCLKVDNCNWNTQLPTCVALSPAVAWAFRRAARARAVDSIRLALLSQSFQFEHQHLLWQYPSPCATALAALYSQSLFCCNPNPASPWVCLNSVLFSSQMPRKIFFLDIRIRCSGLSYHAWSVLNSTCHQPPSLCLCFVSVSVPRVLARTWETFRLLPKHPWLPVHTSFFQENMGKGCKMTWTLGG